MHHLFHMGRANKVRCYDKTILLSKHPQIELD
jgi:hypothetical protein